MNDEHGRPARPRAFVLRLVLDDEGGWHGQVSEPASADQWRATFVEAAALWAKLARRLAASTSPVESPSTTDSECS